ncbi:MAG: carboxypeptidase regulatory-like domain-containing protein, partial [Terriglobia bacterium]
MKKQSLLLMILAVSALMLLPANPSRADNLYGTIRGLVKDQSGAVIPGATVKVTDTGTGISYQVMSRADGSFEVLNLLAPAVYNVTVEKSGFQKFASTEIHLNINQVYVVNAALEVGSATQLVTVQANAAQIDTTSMQLGMSVTGKQIVDLPLDGRDWTQLQQLQPGVVASSDRFGTYSTNGAETQQNSYLINGTDSMDLPLNEPGIIPSPDAIAEFRMVTNTINPEYGRNSGAIMNVIIKNGTNQFHGDGFDFYRDTTLDARNFFQQTVSPFHRNQFGGTIGGPVWRNHTFFFFSYQGNRNAEPQAFSVPTVFSPDERSGNFSADTGGAFPAINPNTGAPAVSPFPMVGADGVTYPAGTPYATLFPAGMIPTGDLNPLAVKLMKQFVPNANAPGNGYTFNPTRTRVEDQYITRIDQKIGASNAIWGYWLWQRSPGTSTLPFTGASLPGFEETDLRHSQEYVADWTHIFSPTTINEARLGYFRFNYDAVVPASPINPTQYGFTGIFPQFPSEASLPVMSLTGLFTLGFTSNGPQPRLDQQYNFVDNFSKIAGRHTLKFGFNMDRLQVYNPFLPNLGGNFSYNGSGTYSTGFPGTDFLLGIPDFYIQSSGSIIDVRAREYYSYAQDQWQFHPNLTLTFGLGWDIETPYINRYDKGELVNAFRPGQQSTVYPTAPVGLLWPGDKGISSTGGPTVPYRDFAPRVGFAWTHGSSRNWSVRGGFGIYYNRTEEEGSLQNLGAPPYFQQSFGVVDIGGSPAFATPFTGWCGSAAPAACSEPNKFPFTAPAPGSNVDFSQFEPMSLNIYSQNYGVPMSENYN